MAISLSPSKGCQEFHFITFKRSGTCSKQNSQILNGMRPQVWRAKFNPEMEFASMAMVLDHSKIFLLKDSPVTNQISTKFQIVELMIGATSLELRMICLGPL